MRKQTLKAISRASLAILVLAVFGQMWVSAEAQNEQGLVGSWDLQVTLRDCDTGTPLVTFAAINTYNQGGTMNQASRHPPGAAPSGGHGVWSHTTGRDYSAAFRFFGFTSAGVFTGKTTVRSTIDLDQNGDSYTSTDTGEILTADGNLIRSCSTSTATRFQ
jgi:hypothetical protein